LACSSQAAYGYTGEYTGDSTDLVYLRARYYAPTTGRFLTKDTWDGDYNSPLTFNRWNYVTSDPINYTDPSGNILDPSDPTQRGTIIHLMIQEQYASLYASAGPVIPEFPIPMGSARGLKPIKVNGQVYWGTTKASLASGYADIVDFGERGLYEIKPWSAKELGQVTVGWYLSAWNFAAQQSNSELYLQPGTRYPLSPTIVGSDPKDYRKWITAELYGSTGVILYGTLNKSNPRTVPVFVFEWDPYKGKVERRSGARAAEWYPQPSLGPVLAGISAVLQSLETCGPLILVPVP
jgi:RHS repeat-associated protein